MFLADDLINAAKTLREQRRMMENVSPTSRPRDRYAAASSALKEINKHSYSLGLNLFLQNYAESVALATGAFFLLGGMTAPLALTIPVALAIIVPRAAAIHFPFKSNTWLQILPLTKTARAHHALMREMKTFYNEMMAVRKAAYREDKTGIDADLAASAAQDKADRAANKAFWDKLRQESRAKEKSALNDILARKSFAKSAPKPEKITQTATQKPAARKHLGF